MGLSRQEYWSALPFPLPGDLPNPGTESWQVDSLPLSHLESPTRPFMIYTPPLPALISTFPLTHSLPPATPAPSWFASCARHSPATRPLHLPCLLPGLLCPKTAIWLPPPSPPSGLCSNVAFSARPLQATSSNSCHTHPTPHTSCPDLKKQNKNNGLLSQECKFLQDGDFCVFFTISCGLWSVM